MAALFVLKAVLVLAVLGTVPALVRRRAVRRRAATLAGLRAGVGAGTSPGVWRRRAAALVRAERRLAMQSQERASGAKERAAAAACAVYARAELGVRTGDWDSVVEVLAAEHPLPCLGVRGLPEVSPLWAELSHDLAVGSLQCPNSWTTSSHVVWGPMPLPPEVAADLPTWVGTSLHLVQFTQSYLMRRRIQRAEDVAATIRAESGLGDQQIEERLGEDGVAFELVEAALDAGQRTEDEEKRRLLALVAARALLGVPGERADHWRTLMRTVAEIEPVDVHLLACLRRGEEAKGPLRAEAIEGWRGDTVLVEPSLGALQRAGLVTPGGIDGGGAAWGGQMVYGTSRYGRAFLDFLLADDTSAHYFEAS